GGKDGLQRIQRSAGLNHAHACRAAKRRQRFRRDLVFRRELAQLKAELAVEGMGKWIDARQQRAALAHALESKLHKRAHRAAKPAVRQRSDPGNAGHPRPSPLISDSVLRQFHARDQVTLPVEVANVGVGWLWL